MPRQHDSMVWFLQEVEAYLSELYRRAMPVQQGNRLQYDKLSSSLSMESQVGKGRLTCAIMVFDLGGSCVIHPETSTHSRLVDLAA